MYVYPRNIHETASYYTSKEYYEILNMEDSSSDEDDEKHEKPNVWFHLQFVKRNESNRQNSRGVVRHVALEKIDL